MPREDSRLSRRDVLKTSVVTGAGLGLAGCTNPFGGGGGGGSGTIKVGQVLVQSGALAETGLTTLNGTKMAIEKINENDGINGQEVELVTRDTELDPTTATQRAQELIDAENVDILFGAASSAVTLALKELVANREEVILFNAISANREITTAPCTDYLFRYTHHAEQQAAAMAPWTYENLGESMYFVYADYAWGQSQLEHQKRIFEDLGGTVTGSVGIPVGESDMSSYISQIDRDAEVIGLALTAGMAVNFFNQSYEFGLHEDHELMAADGGFTGIFNTNTEARIGVKGLTQYPQLPIGDFDNPLNVEFHNEYKERFGENPYLQSGLGYARTQAFGIAANNIDWSGKEESQELISELEETNLTREQAVVAPARFRKADHDVETGKVIIEAGEDSLTQLDNIPLEDVRGSVEPQC